MPTINYSVTQSIDTLAVNLSASEALVMNINNPLVGASYFGLETIPNGDGVYTSSAPKNTSGSFTMGAGILGVVKDDYKMNAVVAPGDSILTFSPSSAVTGSTLRTRGINSSISYDADALAFFTRVGVAGGTLSGVEMYAVNTLVLSLKANSLWTPMKAIYPMVGSSAAACAQNLKSSSFTGTFSNGWTFASTGATPNGTSAYMETNYVQDNFIFGLSFYNRTNSNKSAYDIGQQDAVSGAWTHIVLGLGSTSMRARNNTNANIDYIYATTNVGFWQTNRIGISTNGWNVNYNGTVVAQNSSFGNVLPTDTIKLSAFGGLYSNRQCALASMHDGLSNTQASDLYTAVQAFQTNLSRQV